MGAAASLPFRSTAHQYFDAVFSNENLYKIQALCSQRLSVRRALSKYIKNGTWMDKIAKTHINRSLGSDEKYRTSHGFIMPENLTIVIDNDSSPTSVSRSPSNPPFDESYNCANSILSVESLRIFLLYAISDSFVSSSVHKQWQKTQAEESLQQSTNVSVEPSSNNSLASMSKETESTLELLLSAAAYFDEDDYVDFLKEQWSSLLMETIQKLPFAITICSAEADQGFPLLYANTAWEKMSQQSFNEARGKSIFDLMNNNEQDNSQGDQEMKILNKALRGAYSVNLGIDCRRKSGDFFTLIGVAPVIKKSTTDSKYSGYRCSIMVHSEVKKINKRAGTVRVEKEELEMAKKLLALLPYVVKY